MDGKTIEASSRRRTAGQADETQNHDLAPSFLPPPLLESGEVMWTWNCRRQSLIPHPRRRQRARWSQVKRQHGIGRKGHGKPRAPHYYGGLPVWEMWRYGCRGIPWSCRSAARAARIRAGTLLNSSHRQSLGPRPAPRAPSSSIIHGAAVRSARRVAKWYGQGILSRHFCFHFSILSSTFWQYLTGV